MFSFARSSRKMKVAPSETLQHFPTQSEKTQLDILGYDEDTFMKTFTSEMNPKRLDIDKLPEPFSKESRRLYSIPDFGRKYATTIVHLSHQIDSIVDGMIAELYPTVVYFRPNFMEEHQRNASSDLLKKVDNEVWSELTASAPSRSPSGTSMELPRKLSEVNCCLWILQEAVAASSSKKVAAVVVGQDAPWNEFLKVKLQSMSKSLAALKDDLRNYLYKLDNLQQFLATISRELKADLSKHKAKAKEDYEKYLKTCDPDAICPTIFDEVRRSDKTRPKMKFVCIPTGYSVVQTLGKGADTGRSGARAVGAGDGVFSPSPFRNEPRIQEMIRPLTSSLQSEIMYSIIRELEFRINESLLGTKPILSKLSNVNPDGINLPLDQLHHLAQFCGLKLTSNAAVSIVFALKRVQSKMELFKSVLAKFEEAVAGAEYTIQKMSKSLGKMGKHGLTRALGLDGSAAKMLAYYRNSLVKRCDDGKPEIVLYTDWPECFRDYITAGDGKSKIGHQGGSSGEGDASAGKYNSFIPL